MNATKTLEDLSRYISDESQVSKTQIYKTLTLFKEGATLAFIARYRKEVTGGLDERQLRTIQSRYLYYQALEERKETVLKAIKEQAKLTESLAAKIHQCRDKNELEDLYLPYKSKRKTKADKAIEEGFLPLAELIVAQRDSRSKAAILEGYPDTALEGAMCIIAQQISDTLEYRQWLRQKILKTGVLSTKLTKKEAEDQTKYAMYAAFSEPLNRAASHRLLAIRRGEKEKSLRWKVTIDEEIALSYLFRKVMINPSFSLKDALQDAIREAYKKTLFPSLQTECFNIKCAQAETESIAVFSKNLDALLMTAPAGKKVIMGIDPGFRTGCKVAIVDETGCYQESFTIFPTPPVEKTKEAESRILECVKRYPIEFIAIGNGTASKETMRFIKAVIKKHELGLVPVVVNESGASVYSASEIAIEEYPHLDVSIRGAISIAHRLQDPLSELVKIEPKSIGVGQYQHDVNQTQLHEALRLTTELAVNTVGVDLNTASASLLSYVSGIGEALAKAIVSYRDQNGPFTSRQALLKVPKLGPKAFEQSAGFLRIKMAKEVLDNSAIHPEAYDVVRQMARDVSLPIAELIANDDTITRLDLSQYVTETIGLPTLRDIVEELKKPGLDPRDEFTYAEFDEAIDDISDLRVGMSLEGTVTNVTNFGAFVDIGVHQDGLIHISKLSHSFVKNPHELISVGDALKVTVLEIDIKRKRIQLSAIGPS